MYNILYIGTHTVYTVLYSVQQVQNTYSIVQYTYSIQYTYVYGTVHILYVQYSTVVSFLKTQATVNMYR